MSTGTPTSLAIRLMLMPPARSFRTFFFVSLILFLDARMLQAFEQYFFSGRPLPGVISNQVGHSSHLLISGASVTAMASCSHKAVSKLGPSKVMTLTGAGPIFSSAQ